MAMTLSSNWALYSFTRSIVFWCDAWSPCDIFKRATFIPASANFHIISRELVDGPIVQTILVFLWAFEVSLAGSRVKSLDWSSNGEFNLSWQKKMNKWALHSYKLHNNKKIQKKNKWNLEHIGSNKCHSCNTSPYKKLIISYTECHMLFFSFLPKKKKKKHMAFCIGESYVLRSTEMWNCTKSVSTFISILYHF